MLERIDAWVTPLFVTLFDLHGENKTALTEAVYSNQEKSLDMVASGVACTAKQRLYESDFDFLDQDNSAIKLLKAYFADTVQLAAFDANQGVWPDDARVAVKIVESWCHITCHGGYHDVHSHPNCSWCGIYYLDVGDVDFASRNGVNRFYDPRINAEHYLDAGNSYLNAEGVMDIEPQEGQVILFPSYLKHSALPYFGQQDRLVIAFNAQVHFVE
jgi:uncharacterized protein (TIGR02466 family)